MLSEIRASRSCHNSISNMLLSHHKIATLYGICVCLRTVVSYHILCFCFVFLRPMHPILTVSLDCLFLIASLVFSNVCCKSIRLNRKRFPTMQFLWRHEWSSGSGNFSRDFNLYLHNTTLCIKMFLSFKMNNNEHTLSCMCYCYHASYVQQKYKILRIILNSYTWLCYL